MCIFIGSVFWQSTYHSWNGSKHAIGIEQLESVQQIQQSGVVARNSFCLMLSQIKCDLRVGVHWKEDFGKVMVCEILFLVCVFPGFSYCTQFVLYIYTIASTGHVAINLLEWFWSALMDLIDLNLRSNFALIKTSKNGKCKQMML